jgi:hypothetical protein
MIMGLSMILDTSLTGPVLLHEVGKLGVGLGVFGVFRWLEML